MADQPDYTGSCMIALYPPPDLAASLAILGGLDASSMHVTVAYTGDAADVDPQALNAVAKILARREPITATISGHARFTGGTEGDVIVALVDSPQLEALRRDALDRLGARGIAVPSEHGFTPHLSLQYCAADDPDPVGRLPATPVTFTAISATHAKVRTGYPFGDGTETSPIASASREAFALGWSLSNGPMTDRVRAGCTAAVSLACEHADDPDILETTLKLGSLTGTWALVYDRREKLLKKHLAAITVAWRTCVASLNARKLISRYRAAVYLPREAADQHKDFWKTEATAVALGWLRGIYNSRGYDDLVAAIEDAIRAGMAEGEAGALALAADRAGTTGFAIAGAFKAAYERLGKDLQTPGNATDALGKMIDSASSDLARALASQTADGGSYDDMLGQAMDTAGGTDVRAVKTWADWAVQAALGAGALALFGIAGIQSVSWLTAGGSGVCAACQDNEDNSPYLLGEVPSYPEHPFCRCSLETSDAVPASLFSAFLGGTP